MIKKQGCMLLLLVVLVGAALFLCLNGCNGNEKPLKDRAWPSVPEIRAGIGADAGGELLYEEEPFAGFSDYIGQVDYAIARAVQFTGLAPGVLQSGQGGFLEHEDHVYRQQILVLRGISDMPAFIQTLRDALLAWAEMAVLTVVAPREAGESRDMALQITVDGALTHHLSLSPLEAKTSDERPRLAIVMDDLGESKLQARRLLALNFPVTFAIWPHSTHTWAVAELGYEAGAEIIVHQPMQPEDYPMVNPGPGVILEGMDETRILAVLEDNFLRVPHADGLNNHMGSRLTQDEASMGVIARWLAGRGLLALDSLTHAKSRFAKAASEAGAQTCKRDIFLDVENDQAKIVAQLKKAEQIALVKGWAVAIGHPLPATLAALEEWQHERDPQIHMIYLKDFNSMDNR